MSMIRGVNRVVEVICAECGHLHRKSDVVFSSKFLNQCQYRTRLLTRLVPDTNTYVTARKMSKFHHQGLPNEMLESNIDRTKTGYIVYTRRSQSKLVAKQIPTVGKNLNHTTDCSLKVSFEESLTSLENFSLPRQDGVCDDVVSESMTSHKKRKLVVKGPQPPETEVTVASKGQEVEVIVKREDPWTMLVHKKVQPEWIGYNPAIMRPTPLDNSTPSMKLLSWNVNGLRALLKEKGQNHENPVSRLARRENFDVLCLQETKLQEKDVQAIKESLLPGYDYSFWNCSTAKLGYSGTAVISRIKPLSVVYGLGIPNHDSEGRLITIELEKFYLVAGYIPNSGQKLERLAYRTQEWDFSLSNFLKELEKRKPVVFTGDLNCAHQEMDIHNPDGNRRSAGFTDEERTSFEVNFLKRGMVDTFRRQHPSVVAYTYWGYRTAARLTNKGWRLDYFLASDAISGLAHDSYVLPDVGGSDHCPVGLILKV